MLVRERQAGRDVESAHVENHPRTISRIRRGARRRRCGRDERPAPRRQTRSNLDAVRGRARRRTRPHRRQRARLHHRSRRGRAPRRSRSRTAASSRSDRRPTSATSRRARTQVIDAAQATVTPGFIDTHCHVSGVNELYSVNANVRRVRELQANLKAQGRQDAARTVGDGGHVRRHQARRARSPGAISTKSRRIIRSSSTIAAAIPAGTTPRRSSWRASRRATPDPEHGRFFRDETGELTGRVAELARNVFSKVGTRETFTPEQQRDRGTQRHAAHLRAAHGGRPHVGPRRRRGSRSHPRLRGRARQRRAASSRVLPGPRQRDVRGLQGRRHLLRLRRRVDARRRRQVRAPTARRPSARCA